MMLLQFLSQIAIQIPVIAALVIGVVLSLANRQRFGPAANLALAGFVILLVEYVVGTVISLSVPYLYSSLNMSASEVGAIFGVMGFVRSCVAAGGFGCLIAALFRGR